MDHDDHGIILPPEPFREVVKTMSTSGMPITDVTMKGFAVKPNHPSGGFFGPKACGANFRALLEAHPVFIDPASSLAGAYMVNFGSYRKVGWPPGLGCPHLAADQKRYRLVTGIGGMQHFCQDLAIGLRLGWGGLLEKIRFHRRINQADAFYDGLEDIVLGMQNWITRHVEEARRLAAEGGPLADNLREMAEINARLVEAPPQTFREACQWILWYQMAARMYNGSGSLGRLDLLLQPFYERDTRAGILDDEEAVFHIACILLRDAAYIQLGGPDARRDDVTSRVSYLVLEAAHRLRIPANVGVCVGPHIDPGLLRRGVEILLADRTGIPKFLGVENTAAGFQRNGFPAEAARERAYSGCHWSAIPGREYAIMDCIKVDFGAVFEVALKETMDAARAGKAQPSVVALWTAFESHLRRAVQVIAEGIDFHVEHMHEVFPELVLDLLCHGTIEKGLDASHGGVEFYTFGVDGAALATVADSFAAIEQRVEREGRLSWADLMRHLEANWAGPDGESARLMMRSVPRFGSGGSPADAWADRIAQTFTAIVKERPTPAGFTMIPGLFSWANTIGMGRALGATPNGRRAGEPISHGANPDPGFAADGAPTAMARAVARVQPGYGNTAPLQIDLDPSLTGSDRDVDLVCGLIRGHFDLGGTQININVMDRDQIIDASKHPEKYPSLIVRVTGFSAYFASLSPAFRQLVADRIIRER